MSICAAGRYRGREVLMPATPCPVCESAVYVPYRARSIERRLIASDLRITDRNYGQTLALRRCIVCGFIFADCADLGGLRQLYDEMDDPDYEAGHACHAMRANWLLDVAQRAHPGGRYVLDIGAATGLLVQSARERGWRAEGVEPSLRLVDTALKSRGIHLLQGGVPHAGLRERSFDYVFLVDVLEHVSDPVALLRTAGALLARDGILIVVTPDVSSFARRLLGRHWWHFRLAHVGYFDAASFAVACRRAELQLQARVRIGHWFAVDYLAERIARYLPVGALARVLRRTSVGHRVGKVIVPLNPRDSWAFICRRSYGACG
jgi:2-polyprenyl-3-methyl-5-hydroxy-6-metoxy-1,4-benzoquinol methylase